MSENMIDPVLELDRLGRGELDPGSSLPVVRAALSGDASVANRLYTAFRDLVWHTLFARQTDDLSRWHDVLSYSVTLSRRRKLSEAALQLKVLAELVAQSDRYAKLQPETSLLERKHVPEVLKELAGNHAPTPRKRLSQTLEIADANLSRVLNLALEGMLVRRHKNGKAAAFSLTDAGRAAAEAIGAQVIGAGTLGMESLPFPVAVWNRHDAHLASNSAFQKLSTELGLQHGRLSRSNWRAAFDSVVHHLPVQRENTFEVQLPTGEYVLGVVTRDHDCEVWVLIDVSRYHSRHQELETKVAELENELTSVRAELAEANHRSTLRRNWSVKAYDEFADAARRANHRAITVHGSSASEMEELVSSISGLSFRANLLRHWYSPADLLVPSVISVKETLENSVKDFEDTWGGKITLKVEASAKKARASSLMYTVVNRIFYALLLDHHAGGASLSLRAVADRHHLKCHFVFDPVIGRAENHAGAFEHMDALLGDLESDVRWTGIDNGQPGFVVSVPVFGHR